MDWCNIRSCETITLVGTNSIHICHQRGITDDSAVSKMYNVSTVHLAG